MPFTRRNLLTTAATLTAATTLPTAAHGSVGGANIAASLPFVSAEKFGVRANSAGDQTRAMQSALDAATASGTALFIPAGTYRLRTLALGTGGIVFGAGAATQLLVADDGAGVTASGEICRMSDLQIRGARHAATGPALFAARDVRELILERLYLTDHARDGINLTRCSGRIADCQILEIGRTALRAIDSTGLLITQNTVRDIDNNGIQVWRSAPGEDATQVLGNRISNVQAKAGGDGQNGNGINVFRAGNVIVSNNVISDCAFSAVRGNAASNIQITNNTCSRLYEVAIYAEFGFQGALIANNIIQKAATGISVTNFNEGGRLAVVQGNIIRDLHRRVHEVDIRGIGISAEADTVVQGNVIENAPTLGIQIGWGAYMRNVMVSGNMITKAKVGVGISDDAGGSGVTVTGNMIAASPDGAVRLMDHNAPKRVLALNDGVVEGRPGIVVSGNTAV